MENVKENSENDSKQEFIGLGRIIETFEIQSVIVALIILDSFSSWSIVLYSNQSWDQYETFRVTGIKLLNSLSSFAAYLFALELLAIIISFRLKVLTHIGYIADVSSLKKSSLVLLLYSLAIISCAS